MGLQVLKCLKLVMFGGSPCPDELGDFLVSEGFLWWVIMGSVRPFSLPFFHLRPHDLLFS